MKSAVTCLLLAAGIVALPLASASAQQVGINAKPLVTKEVTGAPDRETTILVIEVAPGGNSGLHTHPGDEFGTVVEGTVMVKIGDADHKPFTVGEMFSAPPNTPMEVKNTTDKPAKVVNVLVLEKGKPRSTQVHAKH